MKNILLSLLFAMALTTALPAKECPSDDADFCSQYEKAGQGDADAQYNLGVMYYSGKGIAQDEREAARWYRKSAEQGDAKAQYNLGVMYYDGEGVAEDKREAYIWYSIAKANGSESAVDTLDKMDSGKFLTTAEIKSARREAARRLKAIEQLIK